MRDTKNNHSHILIVEDSPTQAEILRRILAKEGYDVTIAKNGSEGLTLVREIKPSLVISDIRMPEISGCEMCRKIKDDLELKDIPVILLSVLSEQEEIIKGLHSSADYYITKPYNEEYLLLRIKTILSGHKLLDIENREKYLKINISGKEYKIKPDSEQILNFLFSLYETSIHHNNELQKRNEQLSREISARKLAEKELYLNSLYKEVINTLLTTALKDTSLEEQLETALNRLITIPFLSTIPRAAIFLSEEKKAVLTMRATVGIPKIIEKGCNQISFGKCMCGETAISGTIKFSGRVDSKFPRHCDCIGPHGHFVVPITSSGRTLGILLLFLKPGHKGEEREQEFLKTVAKTMAIMIERKKVEEETKKMQIKMLSTSKMATLGEIATGVAHEINQPLTYISSFLQGLREDIKNNDWDIEDINKQLNVSLQQTDRIVKVIQHLKTFGRDNDVVKEPVNLETVLNNTLILMNERIRLKNIELKIHIHQDLMNIQGNMNQLEQVFINLFQNAIDSLHEKRKDHKISIDIRPDESASNVVIKIEDNGLGIKPEYMDKIFEPFFTTKEVGKGTGLGLSIVYGIIDSHKGSIRCSSKENEGALFTIQLPAGGI